MFARIFRDPLFVFLATGAALYGAYALIEPRRSEPVRLTAAVGAGLIADYEALTGMPVDADARARLESVFVADEILFREALAQGLHLSDGTVRQRLIDRMRLGIAGLQPYPDEEALVDFYAENLGLYQSEPSISFEHVFHAELPPDAGALSATLRAGGRVPGESFRYGAQFPRYGRSMLRGMFGQPFVAALWAAPVGEWSGPIRSTAGWHFVKPAERLAEARLPFDAVRSQVEQDYVAAQSREAVERHLAELRTRYEVEIER